MNQDKLNLSQKKSKKNGKVTTHYHYIDCDKIEFKNPSSQIPQILQVPRFTYTNNDMGINENLGYFRQLVCTHIDVYHKQSKILQTYTNSRIKNSVCEPGNLGNLGNQRESGFKDKYSGNHKKIVLASRRGRDTCSLSEILLQFMK